MTATPRGAQDRHRPRAARANACPRYIMSNPIPEMRLQLAARHSVQR